MSACLLYVRQTHRLLFCTERETMCQSLNVKYLLSDFGFKMDPAFPNINIIRYKVVIDVSSQYISQYTTHMKPVNLITNVVLSQEPRKPLFPYIMTSQR